jgi:hypothetical protein
MKIEEPDWTGQRVQCDQCDRSYILEADDDDKVKYKGMWRVENQTVKRF